MHYYSPSTKGFYDSEFNPVVPEDAISLNESDYKTLYEGLASGKQIAIINDKIRLVDSDVVVTWKDIRNRRNALLKNSDFTQVLDYPGDKDAWAAYRQQLRDIPQKYSDPVEVKWPVSPEG